MTNYRRLISYIYAYEGEVKGKNIGFAKLESRNGQCKLSVNVKKVYVGSSDLGVYLLAPGKEIFLGSIFIRSGCGEFRAAVNVDNAADSGCCMDQCYGLTIHEQGDAWRAYTTIWEDAVAHAAEVELADVTSKHIESEDAQIHRKVEELNQELRADESAPQTAGDGRGLGGPGLSGSGFSSSGLGGPDLSGPGGAQNIDADVWNADTDARDMDAGVENVDAQNADAQDVDAQNVYAGVQNVDTDVQNVDTGMQNTNSGAQNANAGVQNIDADPQNANAGVRNTEAEVQTAGGNRMTAGIRQSGGSPQSGGYVLSQAAVQRGDQEAVSGTETADVDEQRRGWGAVSGAEAVSGPGVVSGAEVVSGVEALSGPEAAEQRPGGEPGAGPEVQYTPESAYDTSQSRESGQWEYYPPATESPDGPEGMYGPPDADKGQNISDTAGEQSGLRPGFTQPGAWDADEYRTPDVRVPEEPEHMPESRTVPRPDAMTRPGMPRRQMPMGIRRPASVPSQSPQPSRGAQPSRSFAQPSQSPRPSREAQPSQNVAQPSQSPQPSREAQPSRNVAQPSPAAAQARPQEPAAAQGAVSRPGEMAPVIHSGEDAEDAVILGDPRELQRLEQEEQQYYQPRQLWEGFRKRYPKILAFDSANGCEILTIKPQDIGLLPRENWNFGNNSFLLHGYYNYRYLILARIGDDTGGRTRYILGVPGNYYSNEKYMASMFGFPHFVLAKKQPSQDGRFGYWYTDVRLDNQE